MANAGAKLSSFPEVNDIQTGDMFPLLSGGNTNAKIDYATLADAIIAKLKSETDDGVLSINGKTGVVTINKSDVGLGNVDNTSDADKPISTATQAAIDKKADKSVATESTDGLMSAADKKAIDREFFRMLPKGGTYIPDNADLNSIEYLKVGNYYNSTNVSAATMNNIPTKQAFMMYVLSPLSKGYDNESSSSWVYRLRIFVTHTGLIYTQTVYSETTNGVFTYQSWTKLATNKSDVGLANVANYDQSKAIKSITRSGTTFTATALDGTTTTFTQQDSNTTYGIATSSADGLMSKSDKAKLDGISSGADAVTIKTVKVNGTALTPDSDKAVNVTVPTLANNATTTAGGMALDARMGKTLSDQASQLAKNTAQIETAGTATNAHSAGEYVMISNALYKVTASVAKGDTWTIGTNVTAANVGNEISSLKSDLANKLYPVGSIYMSVNATNPAELFGGTWEQIKGRFLLGAGPNDENTTDFWGPEWAGHINATAGELGGEALHTLSAAEMPSHAHTVRIWDPQGTTGDAQGASAATYGATLITVPYGATTPLTWNNSTPKVASNGMGDSAGVTEFSGGGKQHNNMPPYLSVYMWKRTA